MIGSSRRISVFAYPQPVDMRKAFDTLSYLVVSGFGRQLLDGDVFVFVGKDRKRAKVLWWDGTGLCLLAKRLSKGRFAAPWQCESTETVSWTTSELSLFLEGSELVGKVRLSPSAWDPSERIVRFG